MSSGAKGPFSGGQHRAHLDALTRPEHAVVSGTATGREGDRVGVSGRSVRNAGVHAISEEGIALRAEGGELAAEFEGGVLVSGDLRIDGELVNRVIDELLERVSKLERQVFFLTRRVTLLQSTINP